MNAQLKTILLTILTLSVFVIALVELSGVSSTALYNKYDVKLGDAGGHNHNDHAAHQPGNIKESGLPLAAISFENTKHSFGKIKEGDKVSHTYKFTNTGTNPLIISDANASCGCTVPSYSKEPIPPGGSGEITIVFNSKDRKGHQQKNVLIHANIPETPMSIGFDADVE